MMKATFTSLQTAPLSQPVTYSRKSTTETDVTPSPTMMPTYAYPMVYPHMAMAGQAAGYQMMTTATSAMPMHHFPSSPGSSEMNPMALQYSYTSSESLYQMHQSGAPIVPAPAPPNPHSHQAMISVKPADQMNVFETSNWVRLVCEVQGWAEAPTYAQAFYNNGVTGIHLAQLTMDDMETYLGIEKLGHRQVLMTSIHAIYPCVDRSGLTTSASSVVGESELSEESELEDAIRPELQPTNSLRRRSMLVTPSLSKQNLLCHDKNLESTIRLRPQLIDESSCASATSNNSMASYVSASSQATDTTSASSINGDRRCKLTLSLPKTPICNSETMLSIRQTFMRADFDAHPRVSERFPNKFIVAFPNAAEAMRALSMKDQLGYDLAEYTEARKKVRGPRPTPSNPQQYKVLHHARMRSGKSMKSQVKGFVEKGEVYWVNQIKGKRARLIKRTKAGDEKLGWVSLRNNAGYQLMAPLLIAPLHE